MGELWRSEEMQLVQLFFQLEAAYETMDELGELGCIQFKDVRLCAYCSAFLLTLFTILIKYEPHR